MLAWREDACLGAVALAAGSVASSLRLSALSMYTIFARKYRPERFQQVLEQEAVTRTLMRAIAGQKVGHAYLFSGPRGVGKTTVARVLVKTLNCAAATEDGTQCCGACEFCLEITKGISLDYQEIDGASHRGIDQIRELKSQLPYASARKKYRVFVIDEAHMLTTEAFNAMLKALEEPPRKVIFILCTTESGKIPVTIRSRCQHLRFQLVSGDHLQKMLMQLAERESIAVTADACFYIAKHANGSIRDAQNLFEQVSAYSGGTVTQETTLAALGAVSKERLHSFIVHLLANDLPANYRLLEELTQDGGTFAAFLYELVELFSMFTYLQAGVKESSLLNMSPADLKQFHELSTRFQRDELYKLLDCCFEFILELKYNTAEQTLRQLALIKLHRYQTLVSNEELRAGLELLAKAANLDAAPASVPQSPSQLQSQSPPHSAKANPTNPTNPTDDAAASTSPPPPPTRASATVSLPPQHKHKPATVKAEAFKLDTWNESTYRRLMTIAMRAEHRLAPTLKSYAFVDYAPAQGRLRLKQVETNTAAPMSADALSRNLSVMLQELSIQGRIVLAAPISAVIVLPHPLTTATEQVMTVFKDAKLVQH